MASRTEEQLAVLRAERRTVRISGNSVSARQLFAERHIVLHTVFGFELRQVLRYMLPEERQVVMAHREMQIDRRLLALLRRSYAVLRTFHEVL